MARVTGTGLWYGNDLNNYRGSVRPVSDALKSLAPNIVQTSDTGQVNFDTITSPAASTVRDYEVYRFGDTLQATKPIFVRVEYTTFNQAIRLGVSTGTGTDGAGNLTGVTTPTVQLSSNAGQSSATYTFWVASTGSYLTLVAGTLPAGSGIANTTSIIAIERFRNADGTPNGEGYHTVPLTNGTWAGYYVRYTNGNTSPSAVEFHPSVLIPTVRAGTSFVSDTVYTFPLHGYAPTLQAGSATIMWAFTNDLPRFSEINMPVYNDATAKWLSLGNGAEVRAPYSTTATAAAQQSMSLVLRWE